jgi:four helix bundle protein
MKVRSYRELIAWQKAMDLVTEVYKASSVFPRQELYGLTSQLRRAAISIPSNIAEGQCRWSTKEFVQFLSVSSGSLGEVETQIILAQRLEYLKEKVTSDILEKSAEVGRLIHGLANSLNKS